MRRSRLFLDFGGFDDRFEGFWLVDGKFREDFAVNGDASCFHTGDQTAIGGTVQPCRGVDTRVPQRAERALAVSAVAVGKLQAFGDRLLATLD